MLVPLFLKLKPSAGSSAEKLRRVDWTGSAIFVAAATCFLIPLTWGGVGFPWDSWQTLFPLLLGLALLIGFGTYEKFIPREPILHLSLLPDFNMVYSLVSAVVNAAIVFGVLYFLPLYFEAVQGYNPILAGVALFPATFTVAPMSIVAGVVISKTGDFRYVTWIGWALSTLGLGIMCLLSPSSSVAQWFFLCLIPGLGAGLLYTSLAIINQAAASEKLMASAISLFIFARMLGQCLGVAISGTVFQNRMRTNLLATTTLVDKADEYSRDATTLVDILHDMEEGNAKDDLIAAYSDSLMIVWAVFCALSGAVTLLGFWLRHVSLDREHETKLDYDGKKGGPSAAENAAVAA